MEDRDGYLALGDSFTEGLHDVVGPDGRHRGWADRVAEGLAASRPGLTYANLAVRGRLLDQVVAEQVPVAERRAFEVVSFHAGANDVLRPRLDLAGLSVRYDRAVQWLTATGAGVVSCWGLVPDLEAAVLVCRGRWCGRDVAGAWDAVGHA